MGSAGSEATQEPKQLVFEGPTSVSFHGTLSECRLPLLTSNVLTLEGHGCSNSSSFVRRFPSRCWNRETSVSMCEHKRSRVPWNSERVADLIVELRFAASFLFC